MADRTPIATKNLDSYGHAPLPWSRPRDLFAAVIFLPTTFLGTTRPDGRPHASGIGALWIDGDIYFTSGPGTRKSRNLAANPACTISKRLATIDIVLEGEAVRVTDGPTLERVAGAAGRAAGRCRSKATPSWPRTAPRAPARRPGTSTASRSTPPSGTPRPSRTARRAGASRCEGRGDGCFTAFKIRPPLPCDSTVVL